VAFFELTSCEGCQLQVLNNEATLPDFLSLFEIVRFREIMTGGSDDYAIAFIEGSVTRADEIERLQSVRDRAAMLVAFGSCACFGGINQLKNRFRDQDRVIKTVYGGHTVETFEACPLEDFVRVDLKIYGCPVKKEELERIVTELVLGIEVKHPRYPVCMECTAAENICLFDLGEACLGPVTRAGCDAWCPANRRGCWGCRGPSEGANLGQLEEIMQERGFSPETILDKLECFGGFDSFCGSLRDREEKGEEPKP
jgi:coenzyme F420-reducing hydrogenase gamma subunit